MALRNWACQRIPRRELPLTKSENTARRDPTAWVIPSGYQVAHRASGTVVRADCQVLIACRGFHLPAADWVHLVPFETKIVRVSSLAPPVAFRESNRHAEGVKMAYLPFADPVPSGK